MSRILKPLKQTAPEGVPNKKEARRRATRKRILLAAIHLFARLGYHKTTIQDIAQHIGMTTGAVFHHYSAKPEILDEVVEELAGSYDRYVDYLKQDHKDYPGLLTGLMEIFIDRYNTQSDLIIAQASLAAEFSGIRGPVMEKVQAVHDIFVNALEDALNRISPRPTHRAAAVCFISGLQGVALQAIIRQGEMDIDELVAGFVRLVGDAPLIS